MANLRSAMDVAFWDYNIASPQNLDGCARAVPGQPFPLDGARASRVLRAHQLSLLGNGFPLGIIPSYSPPPTSQKDLGSFSLQSVFFRQEFADCCLALIGQFRPKKLISSIRAEFSAVDEWEFPAFKDVAKHFVNKSLYSLAFFSQVSPIPESSLTLNVERHGERKGYRTKAILFQKLPFHDISLEAAGPELFIDHQNQYWDLPLSISLDLSSLGSESGIRYRFGIHKSAGEPKAINATDGEVPSALTSGLWAKGALTYEKSKDFWRQKDLREDKDDTWGNSFDVRLREPHAAISGIIGGTCAAKFKSGMDYMAVESISNQTMTSQGNKNASSLAADLFGSVCCTFQHGKFTKLYGDLTRVDARLDFCSAVGLTKRVFGKSTVGAESTLASPGLNLIFQQQVAGPIVFRIDSKVSFDSSSGKHGPHVEDCIYSLNYALRLLQSGKVVAWYSPKRKEGMVELRLFEF